MQAHLHAGPGCSSKQDVSDPHRAAGAYTLRSGLLTQRDCPAPQVEMWPRRLPFYSRDVDWFAQRADHLPPSSRRSINNLSARANHPLDQALSPPSLRLRVSSLEARALAAQSATSTLRSTRMLPRKHSAKLPARALSPR